MHADRVAAKRIGQAGIGLVSRWWFDSRSDVHIFYVTILGCNRKNNEDEQASSDCTGERPEADRQGRHPNRNPTPNLSSPVLKPALVRARHRDHKLMGDVSTG